MTTQDRIEALEQTVRTHDVMINMLVSIGERQQELLEEIRRDNQQTQRLWTRLAQRYGWLDDSDE